MATSTTFIIYNTAGSPISAIVPNTLDGPGGVQQNSDLRMYGLGFANWGEGVNENEYHLVENFACPPLSNYPNSARYALLGATVAAKTPAGQASDELGTGNGINVPVVGQFWYNTTTQTLYINNAAYPNASWTTVGTQAVSTGSQPAYPLNGTLWFDELTSPHQLMIYDSSVPGFVSVAANYLPLTGGTLSGALTMLSTITMSGNKITNLGTPTVSTDAATKGYVDTAITAVNGYLPLSGGTMSGTINMNSHAISNVSSLTVNAGIQATGGLILSGGAGLTVSGANPSINAGGGTVSNIGSPATVSDAVNSTYGDTRWLNKTLTTAQSVQGPITFSNPITIPLTPTVSTQAASKGYVDSSISTLNSGFTGSIGTNGYQKFPTGLILQWGQGSSGGTTAFPIPFPHAVFSVIVQAQAATGANPRIVYIDGQTASGFTTGSSDSAGDAFNWLATGY